MGWLIDSCGLLLHVIQAGCHPEIGFPLSDGLFQGGQFPFAVYPKEWKHLSRHLFQSHLSEIVAALQYQKTNVLRRYSCSVRMPPRQGGHRFASTLNATYRIGNLALKSWEYTLFSFVRYCTKSISRNYHKNVLL